MFTPLIGPAREAVTPPVPGCAQLDAWLLNLVGIYDAAGPNAPAAASLYAPAAISARLACFDAPDHDRAVFEYARVIRQLAGAFGWSGPPAP